MGRSEALRLLPAAAPGPAALPLGRLLGGFGGRAGIGGRLLAEAALLRCVPVGTEPIGSGEMRLLPACKPVLCRLMYNEQHIVKTERQQVWHRSSN